MFNLVRAAYTGHSISAQEFKCTEAKQKLRVGFSFLLAKLFWPTMRNNCSSDREKLLKFEAEGLEFCKILKSLEQSIQKIKDQNYYW